MWKMTSMLQVMTDVEDKNEWKNCFDVAGVRLPTGYFFGASAGTGDLSGEKYLLVVKVTVLFACVISHKVETAFGKVHKIQVIHDLQPQLGPEFMGVKQVDYKVVAPGFMTFFPMIVKLITANVRRIIQLRESNFPH